MAKAAVTRSIRDDHQKNFLKIFEGLTGKHNRWEIWRDFIHLTAIEISNSTDRLNAPERTKDYQTIISKYSAAERNGMAEMLAEVVMGMEQNPDQDFLGSLYMMCELGLREGLDSRGVQKAPAGNLGLFHPDSDRISAHGG